MLALFGLSLEFACTDPRRRDFCGRYADTVSECCPEHDHDTLRAICRVDMSTAEAIGSACGYATRELYDCAEDVACVEGCEERTPDPCAIEQQAMLGVCSASPDAPALP